MTQLYELKVIIIIITMLIIMLCLINFFGEIKFTFSVK